MNILTKYLWFGRSGVIPKWEAKPERDWLRLVVGGILLLILTLVGGIVSFRHLAQNGETLINKGTMVEQQTEWLFTELLDDSSHRSEIFTAAITHAGVPLPDPAL